MKPLASRKRSWPISIGSFFCLRRALAQAGDLVGHGDELLGQCLEPFIVGDQGFDFGSLLGGDALGELLALDVALQDEVGALGFWGAGAIALEELPAQGAATQAVDGLDLLENVFPAFFEFGESSVHVSIVSL